MKRGLHDSGPSGRPMESCLQSLCTTESFVSAGSSSVRCPNAQSYSYQDFRFKCVTLGPPVYPSLSRRGLEICQQPNSTFSKLTY
eukprot:1011900-Amphidinium_carterae.1